jgi:hypothetical protein
VRITKDPRKIVPDFHARYFGIALNDQSLTTGKSARLGSGSYEDWLARQVSA